MTNLYYSHADETTAFSRLAPQNIAPSSDSFKGLTVFTRRFFFSYSVSDVLSLIVRKFTVWEFGI